MSSPLLLIAASGLARETVAACRRPGSVDRQLVGLLDDDPLKTGGRIDGLPILGPLEAVRDYTETKLVVCAGKGQARRAIVERLSCLGVTAERYETVIDATVHVPRSCTIGKGSILLCGTVLTADVRVGTHVVCMPHVALTHDDVLDDYATLAAGVVLGGGVHIGEAAYLGMNASVREHRLVGAGAVLGMGSVLIADQPANSTWAGVPARDLNQATSGKE